MRSQSSPQLSKSRFIAGLQCLKRLYLECYHRDLADPVTEGQQAVFDTGHAVGDLARRRFPSGTLVGGTHFEHAHAVETTKALLADAPVPPLYEAAFDYEGIRLRTDILLPSEHDSFDLIEVKATTRVKAEHIPDVAIQLYVLEQSGVSVNRASLMHIDNQYVYQGGDYDLEQLFLLVDVTEQAHRFVVEQTPDDLLNMWEALRQDEAPNIATGSHCKKPYVCSFFSHCHQGEPEDTTTEQPYVSPNLASELDALRYPVSFLDFETFNPALPIYEGTRPYQVIPFQWSLHTRDSFGQLSHQYFLNNDTADPREPFVTSLLDAVPPQGSIVVYSHFEQTRLNNLAKEFPQYANRLLALRDRLFDLLPVIRKNYNHPGFRGSYSLKAVLPVLVPNLGYVDLPIQEGNTASAAYPRLIANETREDEKVAIRDALLAYCERDTEALAKVLDALQFEAERIDGVA